MRRVTVAEIMQATGLSRATVDRVLNGRGQVHARSQAAVQAAMAHLAAQTGPARGPAPLRADIALRVGRGMMAQMRAAWAGAAVQGRFEDLYLADEEAVLRRVAALCRDLSVPLIITAKNSDRLTTILSEARMRGKRVVTLVSDLTPEARDAFVGIDNRAAGQTAAFLIGRALGDRPTTVAVVLGDIAFRCHEDREIGFRTGLRACFPRIVLTAEAQGEDSADLTRAAVAAMLERHPALGAVYNLGGGNVGLVQALRQAGRGDMLVVGHEVNAVTAPLLREGGMDFALAAAPMALMSEALRRATQAATGDPRDAGHQEFAVYTRFNLPGFAQT